MDVDGRDVRGDTTTPRTDDRRGGYRGAFRLVRRVALDAGIAQDMRDALRARGITPTRAAVTRAVNDQLRHTTRHGD